ncbi:MAG: hypothetical protein LBG92_09325 [Prevotellaceae bacterium]|jgi:hypothetical protein|nr:hypothetical protein [Prevotellaceae bacterium]
METVKEQNELLQRIVNHQLMNVSFCNNPGLLNGKTGCAIFFFHYARYTGNSLHEDFAGELLDEVYEDIQTNTSVSFSSGLVGIACGISYLIHYKFVEGDADDVLEEMDKKIMEKDLRRINDFSLDTGLEGIAWYALCRLYSGENKPFDSLYINDLQHACLRMKENGNSPFIPMFMNYYAGKNIENPFSKILDKLTDVSENQDDLSWKKGLKIII